MRYRCPMSPTALDADSTADQRDETSQYRRRFGAALMVIAVALGVVAVLWLSLSSRGFAVVGDAADGARVVVRGVEGQLDTNLVDRSDIPWAADEVAHLLGWSSLMVIVGLGFRARRSLADLAVGLFAASIGIEVMQKVFISGRSMEAEDISANALGIMLGLMLLVALERLWPAREPSAR